METLVIATRNKGKYLEFKKMFGPTKCKIKSLLDFPYISICESGFTFDENALLKAKTVAKSTKLPALADDSGLEVSALNGKPGIHTARYAGDDATDQDNINKLLLAMKDIPSDCRQARFVCSLALAFPNGQTFLEQGFLNGFITFEPRGSEGFGYDPIFYLPEFDRTLSEVPIEDKNRISHRAKALEKMKKYLDLYL